MRKLMLGAIVATLFVGCEKQPLTAPTQVNILCALDGQEFPPKGQDGNMPPRETPPPAVPEGPFPPGPPPRP